MKESTKKLSTPIKNHKQIKICNINSMSSIFLSPCTKLRRSIETLSTRLTRVNTTLKHNRSTRNEKFNQTSNIICIERPIYQTTRASHTITSPIHHKRFTSPIKIKTEKSDSKYRTFFPELEGFAKRFYNRKNNRKVSLLFSNPKVDNVDEEIKNVMNCEFITNKKIDNKQDTESLLHKTVYFGNLDHRKIKFPNVIEKARMHNYLIHFNQIASIGRVKYYNY